MRNDARQEIYADMAEIRPYHDGIGGESYAFRGFKALKYFTSDRFIRLTENFQRTDGKPLQGFGLEIELACFSVLSTKVLAEVMDKIVFPHFPDDLFKMQRDGSLNGRTSVECITQPMTKEFIRNNYKSFKIMFNTYLPEFQIEADSSCGMHVNLSVGLFGKTEQQQLEAIRKLYYFVNRNYSLCCKLFRRDEQATCFCGRMPHDKEYCKNLNPARAGGGHDVCFNWDHYHVGRVELRLVGGQTTFAEFRNTMEAVFHLVKVMRTISWTKIDDLKAVFSGCNQYVHSRLTLCDIDAATLNAIHDAMVPENLI